MEYSFFKEYQKCILCVVLAVVLICVQFFLKYDLNEVIRIFLQIAAGTLGAGAIKFSVLPTSQKEKLESMPVADSDSKKFYVPDGDTIKSLLLGFILSALLAGSIAISGCSSYTKCYDCRDGALSWQGNILGITGGRYIETACFRLDTKKIIAAISAGEITWEDLTKNIKVEVVIKDGEFCSPDDKSYYKVTLQTDEADTDKKIIYTKKEAIIIKENNNPEK